MYKFILISLVFILFNFHGTNLHSQKIKLITVSIEDIDNKLVIKYDFVKSKENQQFNVSLVITSSRGIAINARSLSGDIGDSVKAGAGKQIIWDYNADGILLQDRIDIEIFADPIIEKRVIKEKVTGEEEIVLKPVGTGKALFLSTIFPGWGLSKIDKGKPYWLMGLAAYGTLGYSYILNKKAGDSYNTYLANTDEKLNDRLLSESKNQEKLSKTMGYTALGIWGTNLIWTIVKARNNNQIDLNALHNKNFQFYTGYDPWTKAAGFTLKLRF